MTDKEMHRLSRRELLQLLLAQVSETEELKRLLAERDDQLTELHENYERLRKRLDQKDAKIHDLRNTLHEERTTRRIELQEAGSIAEAALRLNGIFDVAQKAADQYLENIKMLSDRLEAGEDIFSGEDISDIDWETDLDLTEPAQEEPDALQAPESQEEKGFPEEPEITGSRQDEESDTDSAPSMMDAEEDSGEEQTEPIDIDRLTEATDSGLSGDLDDPIATGSPDEAVDGGELREQGVSQDQEIPQYWKVEASRELEMSQELGLEVPKESDVAREQDISQEPGTILELEAAPEQEALPEVDAADQPGMLSGQEGAAHLEEVPGSDGWKEPDTSQEEEPESEEDADLEWPEGFDLECTKGFK